MNRRNPVRIDVDIDPEELAQALNKMPPGDRESWMRILCDELKPDARADMKQSLAFTE